MNNKEKLKWAMQIAKHQDIINKSQDKQEINDAQNEILNIVNRIEVTDPMALMDIESLIPKFLKT